MRYFYYLRQPVTSVDSRTGQPARAIAATMSSDTTIQTVSRYAFFVAVVLAIGLPVLMIREALLFVATRWTGFLGTHSVHDLVVFAVVWMGLLGLAV